MPHTRHAAVAFLIACLCLAPGAQAGQQKETGSATHHRKGVDRSGHKQLGKASFYARRFAGRKMANGNRMQPHGSNAASKTLPIGTVAKVTNRETGQSTVVTIEDRGPYVPGRIIDLSPGSAREIGLDRDKGVAPVEVAPIAVPLPDGGVKPGASAKE